MTAVTVRDLVARAYTIPTDLPEADGTAAWNSTTLVVAFVSAAGMQGFGYTYGDSSAAAVIRAKLSSVVIGQDAMNPQAVWRSMLTEVRNIGREGIAATAISAVDSALWDLKAKILGVPLARLLGQYRDAIIIYGSGGFTSYDDAQLTTQLAGWVERDGCRAVKMKIGTDPEDDPRRVAVARAAIGDTQLFVDANGACSVKQAIAWAREFAEHQDVRWFEEPVSSDDLTGLRRVRDVAPMEIAAGEYAYSTGYARRMLESGAVDVLQADATRCCGVTGFMQIAALCEAFHTDLSAHCAPALHVHLGVAAPRFRHCEWFHDHVRIEHMLFDGAPVPRRGEITPDSTRPGLGLIFKEADAERFAVRDSEHA